MQTPDLMIYGVVVPAHLHIERYLTAVYFPFILLYIS